MKEKKVDMLILVGVFFITLFMSKAFGAYATSNTQIAERMHECASQDASFSAPLSTGEFLEILDDCGVIAEDMTSIEVFANTLNTCFADQERNEPTADEVNRFLNSCFSDEGEQVQAENKQTVEEGYVPVAFFNEVGSCLEYQTVAEGWTEAPQNGQGDAILEYCVNEKWSILEADGEIPEQDEVMDFFGMCFDNNESELIFPLEQGSLTNIFQSCFSEMVQH